MGTVLVTGGSGFIGSTIASAYARTGRPVRVIDKQRGPLREGISFEKLDLTNYPAVEHACREVETVIHCASLVQTRNNARDAVWATNFGGTQNVIAACREQDVARLIYVSSASVVYDGRDVEDGDESLPYATAAPSVYVESKIAAEKAVLDFAAEGTTRACALRPHLVFGPGDNRLIPNFLARRGRMREIGNRSHLSDFLYIDNFVDAVQAADARMADDSAISGEAFFITNGEPLAFFEFVERVLAAIDHPAILGRVPSWVAYLAATIVEFYYQLMSREIIPEDGVSRFAIRYLTTHHYFCSKKAQKMLNWRPRIPIDVGIERTAEYLRTSQVGNPS
ncbi:MAG: NAD-dependent epimerase/dehydratase family protein [Gammaproteobacteria bacterium]|nr:NAD-dependent epimerase/dehydratase family protein [Gammaproteobacteria bacterium]